MPTINQWMTTTDKAGRWKAEIENAGRSLHELHRFIAEKSVSIVLIRNSVSLSAQTVRIEQTRIQPDVNVGPAGREHRSNAVLLGYKDHPTIPDLDIKAGDKFEVDGTSFEVRLIFPAVIGHVQAWLEVVE